MARYLVPFSTRPAMLGRGDPFLDLHREVNRLFDDAWRGGGASEAERALLGPRIDVHETDNGVEVSAELPGVKQDDVDLRLDDDLLTIRGEKRQSHKDEQAHVNERSYGSFQRSVRLPFSPDPDQVRADFENGVLTVTLPRPAEKEKSRHIPIGGQKSDAGNADQGGTTIDVESGSGGNSGTSAEAASAEGAGGSGAGSTP